MRRARRSRKKWRRPCRSKNRLKGEKRIPASTRSRWEAKARVVKHLYAILPLTCVVVEDVQATTKKSQRWNRFFSPVQVGKNHLYRLLSGMGLQVETREGWQIQALRTFHGLSKTKKKDQQTFDSHCVDAWVLAAGVSGAARPTCTRLWYVVPARLHRRQLHALQPSK